MSTYKFFVAGIWKVSISLLKTTFINWLPLLIVCGTMMAVAVGASAVVIAAIMSDSLLIVPKVPVAGLNVTDVFVPHTLTIALLKLG